MTCYALELNIAYEGSSLLGVFTSVANILIYLSKLDGYLLDNFFPTERDLEVLEGKCDVQNSIAVWRIEGPSDMSFSIYAVSLK